MGFSFNVYLLTILLRTINLGLTQTLHSQRYFALPINQEMKNVFTFCFFLFSTVAFSQNQGAIRGTITDQALNNEPFLFANIQLKGFDTSYQTNFHGNFEISEVVAGTYTLILSYAGYQTEEIIVAVEENTVSNIEADLSPIKISFDDVVGMDTASRQETAPPANTEKSSSK